MGETMHNNAVYVAVNRDVRESKKTLLWALEHLHDAQKLYLLHVHIPFSFTASSSWLEESEVEAIHESEVKDAYESLYKYRDICISNGMKEEDVDILPTSGYGVAEGIVELIYQNNIKKLVMGAAADPHYSRRMSITSSKAEYVSQHAPQSCKMWFVCKGKLIKTKEGSFGLAYQANSFSEFSSSVQNPGKGKRRDEYETETPKEHPVTEEPPEKVRQPKSNGNKAGSSPRSVSDEPPKEFICPISMEIMRDPHIAADGFTYEAERIRTWLRGGKKTSPYTNERLANDHLTPNRALRSMIMDWLQKHPNYTS